MGNCRVVLRGWPVVWLVALIAACGDDDDGEPVDTELPVTPSAGSGSTAAGSGGSTTSTAGSTAMGGAGGMTAGAGGAAGSSGASGISGAAADSGTAGTVATSGTGGAAGAAGTAVAGSDEPEDPDEEEDPDETDYPDEDAGSEEDPDGDGDPTWPPPPTSAELADLPEQLAMGICDALQACLGPVLRELVFDGAPCVPRTIAEIEDGDFVFMQASIDAGRLVFDPAAVAQCVDDYGALGCDLLASRPPASCDAALRGQVAIGGACVLDDDCAHLAPLTEKGTVLGNCVA